MTAIARVDPITGRVLIDAGDAVLAGPHRIELARRYDSSMTWRSGLLGPGWFHPLGERVRRESGRLLWCRADGRELVLEHRGEIVGAEERLEVEVLRDSIHVRRERWTRRFPAPETEGSDGHLASITHASGAVHRFTYTRDTASVHDDAGRALELRRSPEGHRAYLSASCGSLRVLRTYVMDSEGRLIRVEDQHGAIEEYEYDGTLIVAARSRGRGERYFEYRGRDEWGLCARTVVEGGHRDRRLVYNGAQTLVEDPLGGHTLYERDGRFRVVRLTQRDGLQRTVDYDAHGRLVREVDERGHAWARSYDAHGRLASLARPDGAACTVARSAAEIAIASSTTSARAHLDASGSPTRVEVDGCPVDMRWRGGVPMRLERDGVSVELEYDERRALRRLCVDGREIDVVADPLGQVVRLARESEWLERVETASGTRWTLRASDGHSTVLELDPGARLSRVSGRERRLSVTRDGAGRISVVESESQAIHVERDSADRPRELRASGARLHIERDVVGRITRLRTTEDRWVEMRRDRYGRIERVMTHDRPPVRLEHDGARGLQPQTRACTDHEDLGLGRLLVLVAELLEVRSPLLDFAPPSTEGADLSAALALSGVALPLGALALEIERDAPDDLGWARALHEQAPATLAPEQSSLRPISCPLRASLDVHPLDQIAELGRIARLLLPFT